jgi:hypothetical protein
MAFNIKAFARSCVIESGKLTGFVKGALGRNADIPVGVQKMHDDIENCVKELTGTDDRSKQKEAERNGMAKNSHEEQDER